jgi:hypothetical protein
VTSSGKCNGFVTNYKLTSKPSFADREVIAAERMMVARVLSKLYESMNIAKALIDPLLESCHLQALDLRRTERRQYVATCMYASKVMGEGGYADISILEFNNKGDLSVEFHDGMEIDPYAYGSNQEDYYEGPGYGYADHADLDGDGVDELLINKAAENGILQFVSGHWTIAAVLDPGFISE